MNTGIGNIKYLLIISAALLGLLYPTSVSAQVPGGVPTLDIGRFSMGAGGYQAPDEAESDSGIYTFVRYEISTFEFEIDYGISDQNFFLLTADYLYFIPTASGITQTEVILGCGITFANNDPSFNESQFGPNVLTQVRFMDSYAVQLRYDFLGDEANLWTFGLSYSF